MKKRSNILRFSGIFLLFSVLFTHVASHGFAGIPAVEQSSREKDEAPDEKEQQTLSQLTFEVVVPSYAFDFGVPLIGLFSPGFEYLAIEESLPDTNDPVIIDSYFEKLFEHHIAINAP